MDKKGKFKLFSYINENGIIYYKSLNKVNKMLAFSLIELPLMEFSCQFLEVLVNLLKKRLIFYFSLQIRPDEQEKTLIIIAFKEKSKDEVIKCLNIARNEIIKSRVSFHFLKKKEVETRFFEVMFPSIRPKTSITLDSSICIIRQEDKVREFNLYSIDCNALERNKIPLYNLINLTKNLDQTGYFILNVELTIHETCTSDLYFLSLRHQKEELIDFKEEINSILDFNLLNLIKFKLEKVLSVLWRYKVSDFKSNSINFLKQFIYQTYFLTVHEFDNKFEQVLSDNKVKFLKLSDRLFFIEQQILIIALHQLDIDYLMKILKKFYSIYLIFILVFTNDDYQKLLKVDRITALKDLQIKSLDKTGKDCQKIIEEIIELKNP